MASGWSAAAFSSLEGALGILQEGGHLLRLGVAFGVFNLALLTLFLVGLAERFSRESPALGDAVLYLGLIGIAIHALVPIGFYRAVPTLAPSPATQARMRSGWRRCSCCMSRGGPASSS